MAVTALFVGSAPPAITLQANPPNAYGSRTGSGNCISDSVVVTASGGVGTYTYAWTEVTSTAMVANSPSSATTNFQATLGVNDELGATFRCTVTDSVGTTKTIDVHVHLFEISYQ